MELKRGGWAGAVSLSGGGDLGEDGGSSDGLRHVVDIGGRSEVLLGIGGGYGCVLSCQL